MMNLILAVCFAPILPLMYFVLRNESRPKRNIILGVTLPLAAREADEVKGLTAQYKRRLGIAALALAVLIPPAFLLEHSVVQLTYLMIWLEAMIIWPTLIFISHNLKLQRLKKARGWLSELAGVTVVDTAAVDKPKPPSLWSYLPPFMISLIPVLREAFAPSGGATALMYGVFALMVPLFAFVSLMITRQRADVTDERLSTTLALTNVRRRHWRRFALICAWLTAAYGLGLYLAGDSAVWFFALTIVYTLGLVAGGICAEFMTRHAQEKLTATSGQNAYVDEDEHWKLGMFYYNKNDGHFLINHRTGLGMTMNLAKPGGVAMGLFGALMIAALPFFGVWIMNEAFTPVTLTIQEDTLLAGHTGAAYSIPIEDISGLSLIEILPKGVRVWGTGLETLAKGRFNLNGVGSCLVNANPEVPPYVVIDAGGETYVLGSSAAGETRAVYEILREYFG